MSRHSNEDQRPPWAPARGSQRQQRVADVIRREVALLLLGKVKDPRLQHVSVSQVTVSKDLKRATVFYTVYGDDKEVQSAAAGLESAKGFVRKHLARELGLRVTPVVEFVYDQSLVRQEAMDRLLKEIITDDPIADSSS